MSRSRPDDEVERVCAADERGVCLWWKTATPDEIESVTRRLLYHLERNDTAAVVKMFNIDGYQTRLSALRPDDGLWTQLVLRLLPEPLASFFVAVIESTSVDLSNRYVSRFYSDFSGHARGLAERDQDERLRFSGIGRFGKRSSGILRSHYRVGTFSWCEVIVATKSGVPAWVDLAHYGQGTIWSERDAWTYSLDLATYSELVRSKAVWQALLEHSQARRLGEALRLIKGQPGVFIVQPVHQLAWLALALCENDEENILSSMAALRSSLSPGPEREWVLVEGYLWQRDYRAARAAIEAQRSVLANDPALEVELAKIAACEGNTDLQRSHLERALAREPSLDVAADRLITLEIEQRCFERALERLCAAAAVGISYDADLEFLSDLAVKEPFLSSQWENAGGRTWPRPTFKGSSRRGVSISV